LSTDEVIYEVKETSLLTKQFIESHLYLLQWYMIARMATIALLTTGQLTFRQDVFLGVNQIWLGSGVVILVAIGVTGMLRNSFTLNLTFASGLLFFAIFMLSIFALAGKFADIAIYIWVFDLMAAIWLQFRLLWDKAHGV
jgi:hypothetical protein